MIEINYDATLKLPYIYVPDIDGKFMLDSGSTRSFLSPLKANEHFAMMKSNEPFMVTSTHASSVHHEVVNIPLFSIFKEDGQHKFYVYDVDRRYDGVIGCDLMSRLKANINMKDRILETQYSKVPIVYNDEYEINLQPRSEHRLKLPVDLENGDGILNFKQFYDGVRMPSAIVKCENYMATTVIQNLTENAIDIMITAPFTVIKFNNNTCDANYNSDLTDIEIDDFLTDNLSKLRLDHLNDEETKAIHTLCLEYKDIFYCESLPLSFTNQVKHRIRTINEDPIYIKPYRQAPAQAEEIKQQVEKLLKDNVVKESHSPWSAPVHVVPKKMDASGQIKYRMVVDYRRLNEITVDDRYPIPNICDLFDKLGKSTYFSTLDLASGYHQIEIEETDREKTGFSTQNGHYEFLRMPFGLKTAPATFQRTMNNVLRGLQGIHCLVYLDDILIYSNGLQDHLTKLRAVFDRLRQTNFKIQLDKSEFLRKEVQYLGHTLTKDGLQPNNDKIQAVLTYPIPQTQTEIKRFLGFVGYYRRFVKDFSKITQPLTACLKKGKKVITDAKFIEAFQKCKELLINAPILQYPDMTKPFILTTDASEVAIGAVLSQGPVGSDKPVAYASRTLTDTEQKYSAIERELLAIVWATKHFRPYLYGNKFTVYTDHQPLAWLNKFKEVSSKLTRWRLRLLEYDFDIIHKNGKQNANADALSRIQLNAVGHDDDISMIVNIDDKEQQIQEHVQELIEQIETLAKPRRKTDDSGTLTISDSDRTTTASPVSLPDTDILEERLDYPIPSESSSAQTIHSARDMESLGIPILQEAIDTKPNQILVFSWFRNNLQVKDLSRDNQKVLEVFLPLNNEQLIKDFLKKYIRPKIKYFIYFENQEHRKEFGRVIIALFKRGAVNFYECTERVVYIEDEQEQKAIVNKIHDGKTCHRGITETIKRIRRSYHWPNMHETVAAMLNSCEKCKASKYDRKPIKPTLQLTQTQEAPFQEIFIDIFSIESKHYLTLIDAFSKIGQAVEVPSRSTPEIVRALFKYFSFYGIPRKISCDPGTEFNNELLRELTDLHKIQLHIGTPNNPNSMGMIERFHSTIIEIYRLAKYERKYTDAASVMTYAVMAYNNTIHSATDLTPFEVVFGHTKLNSTFDIDFDKSYTQQLIKDHRKRTHELYKHISDKMVNSKEIVVKKRSGEALPDFNIGQTVFAKAVNKRQPKDKPKFQKAIVTGQPERNVLPITVNERHTKIPIKNIKRPPQVVQTPTMDVDDQDHPLPSSPQPGPSSGKT